MWTVSGVMGRREGVDGEWCDVEEGRVWTVSGVMGRRGGCGL